jgi:hypothetical protein
MGNATILIPVDVDGVEGGVPDPLTCTHDEWAAYLRSVKVAELSVVEAAEHRARFERYGRRLQDEIAATRADWTRRLDARDQTAADAEALSERVREMQSAVLAAGAQVLRLHNQYGHEHELTCEARRAQSLLNDQLLVLRRQLSKANVLAEDARRDASN